MRDRDHCPLHVAVAAAEIVASATPNDTALSRRGSRGNSERSRVKKIASRSKLFIPRSSWEAIVKETLQELGIMQSDPRIAASALVALQCAGEAYVTQLLRASRMIADRSNRKTVELEDCQPWAQYDNSSLRIISSSLGQCIACLSAMGST